MPLPMPSCPLRPLVWNAGAVGPNPTHPQPQQKYGKNGKTRKGLRKDTFDTLNTNVRDVDGDHEFLLDKLDQVAALMPGAWPYPCAGMQGPMGGAPALGACDYPRAVVCPNAGPVSVLSETRHPLWVARAQHTLHCTHLPPKF